MKLTITLLLAAGLTTVQPALAGRPLSTDDAGTADPRTCQVESWFERAGADRAWVVAPACGIVEGVEVGADYTLPRPRNVVRGTAGLALKWVPESWAAKTGLGELNVGAKLGFGSAKLVNDGWRRTETQALLLATLALRDSLTVHANLGAAREHFGGQNAALLNVALVWAPRPAAQLFFESQGNNRRAAFGGTLNSAGGRWWISPDRFGLDLTASREAGVSGPTLWTFGVGWYGIGF